MPPTLSLGGLALAGLGLAWLAPTLRADSRAAVGLTALRAEFPDLPTGSNLTLLLGDFTSANTNNAWAVEPAGELAGRTIRYLPARRRPPRFSPHATGVGTTIAGSTRGLLPELATLVSVHSETYCSDILNVGRDLAPVKPQWDLEVHTWNWSDETHSLELIRRMDWWVDTKGITVVEALPNGRETRLPLVFISGYNVITVGVSSGTHSSGTTAVEGAGRTKPDLVVSAAYTSGATPVVGASAGLLIAKAKLAPELAAARDPRVVKALLLAGATKEPIPSWVHTPTQPLDEHYGAGELNIANSYRALVSGRRIPGPAVAPCAGGWDHGTTGSGGYVIEVPEGRSAQFSVALTWHRRVTPEAGWRDFPCALADLNLRLSRAGEGPAPGPLVAASRSAIDNVEHLYLPELPPGRYVLEVAGQPGVEYGLAWHGAVAPAPGAPPPALAAAARARSPFQFETGLSSELVQARAGRPAEVNKFRRKGIVGEVWRYGHRHRLHERAVPTGHPAAGRAEPPSGTEITSLDETLDLLMVDGRVAELRRQVSVSREVR